jgi:hypothetical protein
MRVERKDEPVKCAQCPMIIRYFQMIKKDKTLGAEAPVEAKPSERGNIAIVPGGLSERLLPYGKVLTGDDLEKAKADGTPLYINHFATCPNAKNFRKGKR